jgi:copper chaperone CopZ
VNHEVNKVTGVLKSDASYESGNAIVQFDNSKATITQIEAAINSTGYTVTDKRIR